MWLSPRRPPNKPTAPIEYAVGRALSDDPQLRDFEAPRIHGRVDAGKVVLEGAVSSNRTRRLAESVASKVPGVLRVENRLRTDAELTRALVDALRANPWTRTAAIEVAVYHGVAELRGRATYDAQLAAIKLARAIDGIRDVANYVQLATTATSSTPTADAA